MRDLQHRPVGPDARHERRGPVPALAIGGLGGFLLAGLLLASGAGWLLAFLAYGFGGSGAMLAFAWATLERPRPAVVPARPRLHRVLHG
jgi:hypothetical protein